MKKFITVLGFLATTSLFGTSSKVQADPFGTFIGCYDSVETCRIMSVIGNYLQYETEYGNFRCASDFYACFGQNHR